MSVSLTVSGATLFEVLDEFNTYRSPAVNAEVNALKVAHDASARRNADNYANELQSNYDAGVRDGRAEKAQEYACMTKRDDLVSMLRYPAVMLSIAPGIAPFEFRPLIVTTFGKLPAYIADTPHALPQHQRELIGTNPDTVGIYGHNMLSDRPMFLTTVDHWTLTTPSQAA